MDRKAKIAKSAGLISLATFISRILGYIKDMILAKYFGATGTADAFFVAFRIPNLLRELFAEGSMSSAFIPVLKEQETMKGKEEANRLVRAVFISILIFVGIICVLGIVFAPAIVSIIAPGFLKDPEKFYNTVLLTRIMFPFLLFISLASITMGSLNVRGVFFIPALAPALLNIVIIISVVTLSMQFINPIIAVAIGVTVGGLVQFLIQVPSFFKQGYKLRAQKSEVKQKISGDSRFSFWHPGLKKIGVLILPATAGMAVSQINIFISTILASYLEEGSITYLYYSMRLIQFPIGIFGVAMGMAVLPTLAEHSVKGQMDKLKDDFSFALRLLFFITVPAMVGLIALNLPIVSTLFYRGEFDYRATVGTSEALIFYSVGIWAIVGAKVITSTYYSMQDTRTPVKIAASSMVINIVFSLLLIGPMKHNGLALANSIASGFNFLLLFYFLKGHLGGLGTKGIIRSFGKTLLASIIMGVPGWYIAKNDIWGLSGYGFEKAIYLFFSIILCIGTYLLFSYLIKNEEMGYIINKIKQGRTK